MIHRVFAVLFYALAAAIFIWAVDTRSTYGAWGLIGDGSMLAFVAVAVTVAFAEYARRNGWPRED